MKYDLLQILLLNAVLDRTMKKVCENAAENTQKQEY
jgi:hypothetical protein